MQGHPIHLYNKSNTISIGPDSLRTKSSNKSYGVLPKATRPWLATAWLADQALLSPEIKHTPSDRVTVPLSCTVVVLVQVCSDLRRLLMKNEKGVEVSILRDEQVGL
jgi:hypothetical protein